MGKKSAGVARDAGGARRGKSFALVSGSQGCGSDFRCRNVVGKSRTKQVGKAFAANEPGQEPECLIVQEALHNFFTCISLLMDGKDGLAEGFGELLPEEAEFEVRVNDQEGRYMVASKDLEQDTWFLLESPVVCWPLSKQGGADGVDAGLSEVGSWCEGCLRELPELPEPERRLRPRLTSKPPRLCEPCAAGGWGQMLTEEELSSWRRWQQQRSPSSCVGLEAFGRCLARVALTAMKAKEAGLPGPEALGCALAPFERLQGPPQGSAVELHGTSPAEVAETLGCSEPFRSRLQSALGSDSARLFCQETIAAMAGKLVLNAASFTVPAARQGEPLQAAGVYVLLSTMNHSCVPSVRLSTSAESGAEVSLLTTRPLQAGDRLTLAYVSPEWPLEERQQQLSHWFFKCSCPRCEAEGRIHEALEESAAVGETHGFCVAELMTSGFVKVKTVPARPPGASGPFLRMLSINDVYTLENYARFATAVKECKAASKTLGCVVTSHLNGDFLSPCLHTSLDGGTTMMQALNFAQVDYACLGNHEFDMDKSQLETRLPLFKGKLINTNGMDEQLKSLPKYDVVEVGDKKVVFVGLCMTDKSIFAASNCPDMRPFVDSCTSAWEQAFKGQQVDVLVPMTHQFIEEDRLLAEQFEMHEALNSKVPVILGGHEHDIFEEMAADTLILKTGQDAAKIAVVDIWWASDGVKCRHSLIPAEKFKPEASAAAWANGRKKFVQTAMEAAITELPKDMSTKQCRFEPCDLGGFLLEKVKRGFLVRKASLICVVRS
ncbi:unnamed protein product [Effrenium voratum]|nr:unnamed protein product [Effrenium voratum]